jgi:predicted lipoprotein with Yx(FWY)xxD motif
MLKTLTLVAACCLPLAAFATPPKIVGGSFVDQNGHTLYTFDKDTTAGQSTCTGGCTTAWPAATADAADQPSGDWTVIAASDGKQQWAYKGHPLYRFAKDMNPGDKKGDGFKDMWHVAKP